jgi:DNA-binding FrmR family transcriptional regulator
MSFAGTLISLISKIYDGIPTPEDELEEYAAKVSDAASRVKTQAKTLPRMTPEERKLSQVAQECVAAAEALKKETQIITRGFQKGKVLKAVQAAFRASQHKKKIEGLNQSLKRCQEVMATELLLKNW